MKGLKKISLIIATTVFILLISACIIYGLNSRKKVDNKSGKIDDWKFNQSKYDENHMQGGSSVIASIQESTTDISSNYNSKKTDDSYIGYKVGGANNIDSFRQNIKNNYLPLSTDITYNGLYSEYYFDTGRNEKVTDKKFYPTYSFAMSTDPISNKQESYMSIGLNSNLKESDFKRKSLNLVILLDISGSMDSTLNSYYYDNKEQTSDGKSKMKLAEECINNLIDKLSPEDKLGIVLFDDQAYLGKELRKISETDVDSIKNHILEIEARGGTNFSVGYERSTDLFEKCENNDEYQNRIIVITDAMPNLGNTSSEGLYSKVKENSNNKIYTSFIGVGVDFNTELIEKISDVQGANYYSVHDSDEFNKTLVKEFDYMVTPLIYDLNLDFISDDYEIENIYGTDSADKSTGNIVHVNTLFPSSTNSEGDVKGGIIVLKLKKKSGSNDNKIELKISYKDTSYKEYNDSEKIEFKVQKDDYYDNLGIQKAIVLARYVNTIKNWIVYEKSNSSDFIITEETGIKEYDDLHIKNILGEHERESVKLVVSENYKNIFKQVKNYIEEQNKILKDDNLLNEMEILNKLI